MELRIKKDVTSNKMISPAVCRHRLLDVEYLDRVPTGYLVCQECGKKILKSDFLKNTHVKI